MARSLGSVRQPQLQLEDGKSKLWLAIEAQVADDLDAIELGDKRRTQKLHRAGGDAVRAHAVLKSRNLHAVFAEQRIPAYPGRRPCAEERFDLRLSAQGTAGAHQRRRQSHHGMPCNVAIALSLQQQQVQQNGFAGIGVST